MEELWTYTVIVMSVLAIVAVIYHVTLKYSKYGIDTMHLPADSEDIPSDVPDFPFGQCCPPPLPTNPFSKIVSSSLIGNKFDGMESEDKNILEKEFTLSLGDNTFLDISLMQEQNNIWRKYNFPYSRKWHPMAGINEEIGEAALAFIKIVEAAGRLNHGALKKSQDIRVDEDHDVEIKDAIGDIFIYSLDFCNRNGINMFESIKDAWEHVRQRDWQQNKKDGS